MENPRGGFFFISVRRKIGWRAAWPHAFGSEAQGNATEVLAAFEKLSDEDKEAGSRAVGRGLGRGFGRGRWVWRR